MTKLDRIQVDRLDEHQPLGRHLILLFRAFEDELADRVVGYSDITTSDLEILRFVSPHGSRSIDVAKLAGMTKQGAGKAIHSLEERGYLKRSVDPADHRSKLIVFTKNGESLLDEVAKIVALVERRYGLILGRNEFQKLKTSLRLLYEDHQRKKPL